MGGGAPLLNGVRMCAEPVAVPETGSASDSTSPHVHPAMLCQPVQECTMALEGEGSLLGYYTATDGEGSLVNTAKCANLKTAITVRSKRGMGSQG